MAMRSLEHTNRKKNNVYFQTRNKDNAMLPIPYLLMTLRTQGYK